MAAKSKFPTMVDIMKSPEFNGEEALDHKAFQIRSVIKSGKHGQVALCDSADEDGPWSRVAIKTEIIKSPHNPHARPYREYFILKQLGKLCDLPEFYVNPQWVGFIQILDWFKAKTDQVRITEGPFSPEKTPTKLTVPLTSSKPSRSTSSLSSSQQAPRTAPKSMANMSRMSLSEENEDVGNLTTSMSGVALTPSKRSHRSGATPTPKRVVPRTPLLLSTAKKQREIKLQEGNLVLERADTTLYNIRHDLSFEIWRDLLFQILYALHISQSQFEFVHHDLHLQNVLLKKVRDSRHPRSDPHKTKSGLDDRIGIFKDGETTWYSKGPWIVKLSDFGLSRIKLVDGSGDVVYDVAQPLSAAFVSDRDVLKILEEFSRVKITRWLTKQELSSVKSLNMSSLKSFEAPDDSITLDQILSTMQPQEAIDELHMMMSEKQKSVKSIRAVMRRSALHVREILHHEFFNGLKAQPTALWTSTSSSDLSSPFSGGPTSPTKLPELPKSTATTPSLKISSTPIPVTPSSTPSFVVASASIDRLASSSPESPPLPIKRLSFSTAVSEEADAKTGDDSTPPPTPTRTPSKSAKRAQTLMPLSGPQQAQHTTATTPTNDELETQETSNSVTPARSERRSARVAKKVEASAANSPTRKTPSKPLVKPDTSIMVTSPHRHSSSKRVVVESEQEVKLQTKSKSLLAVEASNSSFVEKCLVLVDAENTADSATKKATSATPSQSPTKASTRPGSSVHRKPRRSTILPSQLDSVLPPSPQISNKSLSALSELVQPKENSDLHVESVNRNLARLSLDPSSTSSSTTSDRTHSNSLQAKTTTNEASLTVGVPLSLASRSATGSPTRVNYGPIPARFIDPPMILPRLDEDPLDVMEALRDYTARRAQKLADLGEQRKRSLQAFFVRDALQLAAARAERLAKRRKRVKRVARRSLGAVRSSNKEEKQLKKNEAPSSRPRRKSISTPSELVDTSESLSIEDLNEEAKTHGIGDSKPHSSPSLLGSCGSKNGLNSDFSEEELLYASDSDIMHPEKGSATDSNPGERVAPRPYPQRSSTRAAAVRANLIVKSSDKKKELKYVIHDEAVEAKRGSQQSSQRITSPTVPTKRRVSRRSSLTPVPLSPLFPDLPSPSNASSSSSSSSTSHSISNSPTSSSMSPGGARSSSSSSSSSLTTTKKTTALAAESAGKITARPPTPIKAPVVRVAKGASSASSSSVAHRKIETNPRSSHHPSDQPAYRGHTSAMAAGQGEPAEPKTSKRSQASR